MGSRTLPYECPHGVTVDWGDFGPCQDCDDHEGDGCPNYVPCERCEADADKAQMDWALQRLRATAGDRIALVFDGDDVTIHRLEQYSVATLDDGSGGWVYGGGRQPAYKPATRFPLYRLVAAGDGDPTP